jgi:8-oxo-dGTP pyrophosphatase MutT (NUDIX family)
VSDKQLPEILSETRKELGFGKSNIVRRYRFPDGEEQDHILWGAKKTPVIIVPLVFSEGELRIVVIRDWRAAANRSILELPGGNPKEEEGVGATAERELAEETNYSVISTVFLGKAWFEPSSLAVEYSIVLVFCFKKQGRTDLTEKIEEIVEIPLPLWLSMIDAGEIVDSKTVLSTRRACGYLKGLYRPG